MPEKTAASIFIERGLKGEPITPFSHSMYRPMLYVDIMDVCEVFYKYTKKILDSAIGNTGNSLKHVFNIYYPQPITILEIAEIIRDAIIDVTNGKQNPPLKIKNTHPPILFSEEDKRLIKVDISKTADSLGIKALRTPKESAKAIVKKTFLKKHHRWNKP